MELSTSFVILVPVVLGVVQVIKSLGLSSRFAPIVSVILGILAVYLFGTQYGSIIFQGIIVGLTACGLWSGSKAVVA